ncbi:prolyl 4-hydroxylase subunit alpha-1 [Drosophila busckii]|uniref:prolyl 4-hydroxylase subunit alpha-1 n=1 Tax=Drosophila busckii TaxID=30019 RepID=UPI0014331DA4|nr:prolyl 4-hydroxylase subunit alpha-1 [Drosophila busckii]
MLRSLTQDIQAALQKGCYSIATNEQLKILLGPEQIEFLKQILPELPTYNDLDEATLALVRIQETYALDTRDMAKGFLAGVQYDIKLTPCDCAELGLRYLNMELYGYAQEWSTLSLELLNQTEFHNKAPIAAMQEFRIFVLSQALIGEENFARLCRSPNQTILSSSHLRCFYKTNGNWFLRLAPFKLELLSLAPYVVVYHDVISQAEIDVIVNVGQPEYLEASTIDEIHRPKVSTYRWAKGNWIPTANSTEEQQLTLARIQQRIRDMTELAIDRGKLTNFQLITYGFGGQYKIHFDFSGFFDNNVALKNRIDLIFNDRIGTVLFYLNDPNGGGATVFPFLNLKVAPERGKALFWHSLDPKSFDYEMGSLHAGCPVLVGQKTVLVQWIHEREQMFTKPCFYAPVRRTYNYDIGGLS